MGWDRCGKHCGLVVDLIPESLSAVYISRRFSLRVLRVAPYVCPERRRARGLASSWTPLCGTWTPPCFTTLPPSLSSSASTLRSVSQYRLIHEAATARQAPGGCPMVVDDDAVKTPLSLRGLGTLLVCFEPPPQYTNTPPFLISVMFALLHVVLEIFTKSYHAVPPWHGIGGGSHRRGAASERHPLYFHRRRPHEAGAQLGRVSLHHRTIHQGHLAHHRLRRRWCVHACVCLREFWLHSCPARARDSLSSPVSVVYSMVSVLFFYVSHTYDTCDIYVPDIFVASEDNMMHTTVLFLFFLAGGYFPSNPKEFQAPTSW